MAYDRPCDEPSCGELGVFKETYDDGAVRYLCWNHTTGGPPTIDDFEGPLPGNVQRTETIRWQRELVGIAIFLAFGVAGFFLLGGLGAFLGMVAGTAVAIYTRTI